MFDRLEDIHDLFELKLQSLYKAEKQLVRALPAMAAKATNPHLRTSLEKHLRETENHVLRLQQIASSLRFDLTGLPCKAMEGLLTEAEQLMGRCATPEVRDAALLSAAQGVEHYEMAEYGTAVHFARRLGYAAEAEQLYQILQEEKSTDELLRQLASGLIDERALAP